MEVSFRSYILIRSCSDWALPATPALQTWTQSGGLYIGGDQSAFFARYPAPVTAVVSSRFLSRDTFANRLLQTYTFVPQ